MKRILSLLLIVILMYGMTGCKRTVPVPESMYHTELSFSELADSGIDAALEIARAKELLFRIERGELTGLHAQETLDARTDALRALQTDAAIAYVRYCLDVTNEGNKQAYESLAKEIDVLSCILVDAALLLSKEPSLKDVYDAETVEALKRADMLSDPSVISLFERERTLVGAYEALSGTLSVERNGRAWTGDEILSDPALSAEDFDALYEAYLDLFHTKASEIFLKLIRLRREIADRLGYDSYADYRYACYGRTYTPEDAARLSERVQKELVPLLTEMRADFYGAAQRLYGAAFAQAPTMERIGSAVSATLPALSEPWDYMLSHDMIDLGTDFDRMPGSFTTYFDAYGAPFLFSSWTGGFDVIPTVVHEFGHYAAFFLNGGAIRVENSLDLAEIDAQGLELLIVLRYDTLYHDLSDAAEAAELFYALYTLADGCAEDAFQQFAYAQEEPTPARLDAEYARLCTEYGLDTFGAEGRSWTQILHTFQSPFYYISYTTSMITALELYVKGVEDPDGAAKAYETILMRDGAGFTETLDAAGLRDPFAAETVGTLIRGLKTVRRNRMND